MYQQAFKSVGENTTRVMLEKIFVFSLYYPMKYCFKKIHQNNIYFSPTLLDINECTSNTANCAADRVCRNTEGSFSCDCKPGFTEKDEHVKVRPSSVRVPIKLSSHIVLFQKKESKRTDM